MTHNHREKMEEFVAKHIYCEGCDEAWNETREWKKEHA